MHDPDIEPPAPKMTISEAGIAFIKGWEGFRERAYLDIAGAPTVGYGHTRTVAPADVEAGKWVTREDAEKLLRSDLKVHERRVGWLVTVPLARHEFDALVSFDFNTGGLDRSTALKRLNAGDRAGAAEALTWWNKATIGGKKVEIRGLTNRRAAEQDLFLNAAYGEDASRPRTA